MRWSPPADVRKILSLFHAYLYRFGNDVVVVFDCYCHGPSVKDQEHLRRKASCRSVAPTRNLAEDTTGIGPQEPFLANISNKMGFIQVLKNFLERVGIHVVQAEEDADTEIVSVALQFANNTARPVAVVAEDTDILALLLFHRQSTMSEVFLCSEAGKTSGRTPSTSKCIKISSLQNELGSKACQRMLAVHAFGGCDSTSAIFGHGKGTISKLMDRSGDLHNCCLTLQSSTVSADEVKSAGVKLFAALYGEKVDESLAETTLSTRFRPESLPPSDSAAAMHALRVHYQCVVWAALGRTTLTPTDWGWMVQDGVMTPIHLEGEISPSSLLKVIKCTCTTHCTRASCSCRKYGLHCLSACKPCRGTSCANRGTDLTELCDGIGSDIVFHDNAIYFFDEEVV